MTKTIETLSKVLLSLFSLMIIIFWFTNHHAKSICVFVALAQLIGLYFIEKKENAS